MTNRHLLADNACLATRCAGVATKLLSFDRNSLVIFVVELRRASIGPYCVVPAFSSLAFDKTTCMLCVRQKIVTSHSIWVCNLRVIG